MENTNKQIASIIEDEFQQLYEISFFEPYIINYIADFKPKVTSVMSDNEFQDYIHRKNDEAMQEFCIQIKQGYTINNATTMALRVLLSDLK